MVYTDFFDLAQARYSHFVAQHPLLIMWWLAIWNIAFHCIRHFADSVRHQFYFFLQLINCLPPYGTAEGLKEAVRRGLAHPFSSQIQHQSAYVPS